MQPFRSLRAEAGTTWSLVNFLCCWSMIQPPMYCVLLVMRSYFTTEPVMGDQNRIQDPISKYILYRSIDSRAPLLKVGRSLEKCRSIRLLDNSQEHPSRPAVRKTLCAFRVVSSDWTGDYEGDISINPSGNNCHLVMLWGWYLVVIVVRSKCLHATWNFHVTTANLSNRKGLVEVW